MYDPENIFAKILRGEIPSTNLYEDDYAYALPDINPQAPVHAMVIPKGPYVDMDDLTANGSDAEVLGLMRAVGHVARDVLGLKEGGYRLLVNNGPDSNQEVPHLHIHIVGGHNLGPLLTK
jgi:histidine triad (HIT) family protein